MGILATSGVRRKRSRNPLFTWGGSAVEGVVLHLLAGCFLVGMVSGLLAKMRFFTIAYLAKN
jgi:hypothetical protein